MANEKERKNWKDNEDQQKTLFEILTQLRGPRKYKNSIEWKEHCKITSTILSNKYNEDITPNQVEMRTILPTANSKIKYGPANSKTLAYAILSGWMLPEYLNDMLNGSISFADKK